MNTRAVVVVVAIISVGACRAADHSTSAIVPPPHVSVPTRPLLEDLSLLTTGHAPTDAVLARWTQNLTSGNQTTDNIIDELLRDPQFLKRITKVFLWDRDLYLAIARFNRHPGWILKNTGGDNPIYYAREPCDAAVAEDVKPWWDMKTTVKVCPDSYRPTVLWMNATRACSASVAQPEFDKNKVCGCGPNLMRCTPDEATFLEFKRQFVSEIEDTVADVVDRDLPLSTVYLQNETVRKPLVELQYNIWRAERGEITELPDVLHTWPAAGKRAPRYEDEPGDHAGIATSAGTSFSFAGLRAWMRALQQSMWCVSFDNSHVEASTLLAAVSGGNSNLRGGEGWKKLAAHPVCGHCHARMDYGWQFFVGYADQRVAAHFIPPKGKFAAGLQLIDTAKKGVIIPDARTLMGNLYMNDFQDFRGARPRIPLEYTKWAVEQPEFAACQSRRVVDEVFGRDATSEDRVAVASVFEKTGRFRPMMREALRRYVQRKLAVGTTKAVSPATGPTFLAAMPSNTAETPDAMITVMPETRALIERNCSDCHDHSNTDPNRNFDTPQLSRERMMLMISYVADRRMPKTTAGLDPQDRTLFLETMISNLFTTEADRRAAFEYYSEELIATTVQLPDAALSLVYQRAGAIPEKPVSPMIEPTLPAKELQYTPGFAAHITFEALRACKAAGAKDLSACVERATDLQNLVRPE